MPTTEAIRAAVDRYAAAVSSSDVGAVLALFTPDAVQHDPANQPEKVGHEAIGKFFEDAISVSDSLLFEVTKVHTCADYAAVNFRVTTTMAGGAGTLIIEGVDLFTYNDDLLITHVLSIWDDPDVTVQL